MAVSPAAAAGVVLVKGAFYDEDVAGQEEDGGGQDSSDGNYENGEAGDLRRRRQRMR